MSLFLHLLSDPVTELCSQWEQKKVKKWDINRGMNAAIQSWTFREALL